MIFYTLHYLTVLSYIFLITDDVCCVKRKSAGGDAPDGTPAEGVTPEKKAKLEEKPTATTETEKKENVEAAA